MQIKSCLTCRENDKPVITNLCAECRDKSNWSENDIQKGLIIREPWIDLILDGKKTWEIRGRNTKIRGRIFLIKSGTGTIVGECELIDSLRATWSGNERKHRLSVDQWRNMRYKKPHAWSLRNPIRYDKPIPYIHPQGAVIWVNLDDEVIGGKIK